MVNHKLLSAQALTLNPLPNPAPKLINKKEFIPPLLQVHKRNPKQSNNLNRQGNNLPITPMHPEIHRLQLLPLPLHPRQNNELNQTPRRPHHHRGKTH
jgi:hypothetical protein